MGWRDAPLVEDKVGNPQDFAKTYKPAIQSAATRLGVSPEVLTAQFGLETGWGRNVIPGTNNLGNIKDPKGVPAKDSMLGTVDKYARYESPEQFADAFSSLIKTRYPNAIGAGDDALKFATALKAGGYAEDPAYVQKMVGARRMVGGPSSSRTSWRDAPIVDEDMPSFSDAQGGSTSTASPNNYIPTQTGGDPRLQQRDPVAAQQRRNANPALNNLMDFAHGASTVGRGGLNLINQMNPDSGIPAQGRSDMVSPGMTGAKFVGGMADPGALLVGGAIGKALPYTQVLGNGFMGGIKATARNLVGGAAVGAPLGALNAAAEGGDTAQGELVGAGAGALANVILPPALGALGNLAGKAFDMLRGKYGDVIAGKILREASGPDLQRIKQMAANAPADETAAQATAGTKNRLVAAMGDYAERRDPGYFGSLADRKTQARFDALAQVAGGDTQTASQQAQQAVRGELNAITGPMGQTELNAANTAGQVTQRLEPRLAAQQAAAQSALQDKGRFQTMAAQQEALANGGVIPLAPGQNAAALPRNEPYFNVGGGTTGEVARSPQAYPVPGQPRFPGRYTENAARVPDAQAAAAEAAGIEATRKSQAALTQYQLDSLAAHGLKPLDTDALSSALTSKMNAPETRMIDLQVDVLRIVKDKIARAKELNGGIVDARDLYGIRKDAVNDAVENLLGGKVSQDAIKERASKLLLEVRPLIDEAIEKAGGTGWRKYLNAYEAGARITERQKLGAKALEYAKDAPGELVKLARGDKPDVVSKIFMGENDVQAALGKQFPIVQKAASEIERDQTLAQNAAKGAEALNNLLDKYKPKFRIPNWFNPAVTASNRGLQRLEDHVGAKTADALTNAMKSGKSFAEAINLLPLQDRNKALLAFKAIGSDPTLRAAGLNSLLSEQK